MAKSAGKPLGSRVLVPKSRTSHLETRSGASECISEEGKSVF